MTAFTTASASLRSKYQCVRSRNPLTSPTTRMVLGSVSSAPAMRDASAATESGRGSAWAASLETTVRRAGRRLAIFFYDGPVSRAVAFENLLSSGENFAHRLAGVFSEERDWPELVHIATDGESYGHHHRFGDMALAYAFAALTFFCFA